MSCRMNLNYFKQSKRCKNIDWSKHSDFTLNYLSLYINKYNTISTIDHLNALLRLLENDFDNINIEKRLNKILTLKNDSVSKNSFILRYGKIIGIELYEKRKNNLRKTSSKKYLIEKYGNKKATKILKSKCPNNITTLKIKYPTTWKNKINEYKKNYSFANSVKGYILKYGEEIGKKKWKKRLDTRKISNSIKGYILKYGEEIGKKKWKEKCDKQSYKISKKYYIDTYGEFLGSKLSAENSIYGLIKKNKGDEYFRNFLNQKNKRAKISHKEKMIEKYGNKLGQEKYKNYIAKQKYAHTLNYFFEKYGKNLGLIKYNFSKQRLINNIQNTKKNKSLISLELFVLISKKIKDDKHIYYHHHNKEKFLIDTQTKKLYFYDFVYKNKIIEFNGDFWHMNPKQYTSNDINVKTKLRATDVWEHDKFKIQLAHNNNFKIKTIWESDYKNNKITILNECINFLTYE